MTAGNELFSLIPLDAFRAVDKLDDFLGPEFEGVSGRTPFREPLLEGRLLLIYAENKNFVCHTVNGHELGTCLAAA